MKVTGFSFIKNALIYDYPILEAIRSVLPLCDDFVIAVGKSEDNTLQHIQSINSPKITILETIWNDDIRKGGEVLALETNKAFQAIEDNSDWCIYIQGDEVMHEEDYPIISSAMHYYKDDPKVEGLLFDYLHFYGSYDYVATSSKWYKKEIRIIKNLKNIYSYRDAQGFRIGNNQKLKVANIPARIHHYGWVKSPKTMQKKQKTFQKLWHPDNEIHRFVADVEDYDFSKIDILEKFQGTHPMVMEERIHNLNWTFDVDIRKNKINIKDIFKYWVKKSIGLDFNYKNYKIVDHYKYNQNQ